MNANGNGHRDPLPSPAALDQQIRELVETALLVRGRYLIEYRHGLEAPGRSEIGVSITGNGHGSPTEQVFISRDRRDARQSCRQAAKWIREARRRVELAEAVLAPQVPQRRRVSPDSVLTQVAFDQTQHLARERALRGES